MRVLFVSDVYFPRVNGVSTSIRTFREDLARLGVDSVLVAPQYPGQAPCGERDVIRMAEEREEPFALSVVRVLTDENLRRTLAHQGRAYARGRSSAVMTGRLAQPYRSLCRRA